MSRTVIFMLAASLAAFAQQPQEDQPVFGFSGHTLNADEAVERGLNSGVLVNIVPKRSTAWAAGLRRDDVIVEADSTTILSLEQLGSIMAAGGIGSTVSTVVVRDGERIPISWRVMGGMELNQGLGQPIPPLRVDTWIGEPVTREDLVGNFSVIVFWWNGIDGADAVVQTCRDLHAGLADKGVVVVPVHVIFRDFTLHPAEAAETYVRELDLPMSAAASSGERFARPGQEISPPLVIEDFSLFSVPTVIIGDPGGNIAGYALYSGQPDFAAELQKGIEQLIELEAQGLDEPSDP